MHSRDQSALETRTYSCSWSLATRCLMHWRIRPASVSKLFCARKHEMPHGVTHSSDTSRLQALEIRSRHSSTKVWILSDGLEGTSAEGVSLHVDCRTEEEVHPLGFAFVSECRCNPIDELLVEHCSKSGSSGKARAAAAVENGLASDACAYPERASKSVSDSSAQYVYAISATSTHR